MRRLRITFFALIGISCTACTAADDSTSSDSGDLTEADLDGKPYIQEGTYTGPAAGYARNGVETEATFAVSCVDGPTLVKMLHTSTDGRTLYQKLRTPNVEAAFATEYGIDQMPWDGDAHAVREQFPLMWLSIESGRYEPDPQKTTGARELSLGTDIMDDAYYDTRDFILTDNDMELRARARWDTPTQVRRILIGNKVGSSVDAQGIKKAAKEDMRQEPANQTQVASLDNDTRRGFVSWSGTDRDAVPVRQIYEKLAADGKLPDVGTHKKVLLLEPQIHLRQVRSRFHLNEASFNAISAIQKAGPARIQKLQGIIAKARAAGAIPAANEPAVASWEKKAAAILDGSLLAERAAAAVTAADPTADVTPAGMNALVTYASSSTPLTDVQLEARRVASEAISALYHELGTELDGIRRVIAVANDRTLENEPVRFVRWLKSADNTALGTRRADLAKLTTYDRFVDLHAALSALAPEARDAQLAAYNTYGQAQVAAGDGDFATFIPITAQNLAALGQQLINEEVRIYQRQLQAAGTATRGLWFDAVRQHWIPRSNRQTGQFIIDSTDAAEFYRHADWETIPADARTADKVLPEDKLLWGTLSNDVQIELGLEQPYVDRIEELEAQPAGPERDKQLAGAVAVYDEYRKMLGQVSQLKSNKILRELKRAGGPSCMEWKPIDGAKGVIGFAKLRGR